MEYERTISARNWMQAETKPKVLNRLNRIEGQVRGIARMVEEDRYCVDVLTQLRAARAFLGIDQRKLAELSGLSLPTIQRMEASDGVVRGNVDSLMKLVAALDAAGIELITDNATSSAGGRGVRLKRSAT